MATFLMFLIILLFAIIGGYLIYRGRNYVIYRDDEPGTPILQNEEWGLRGKPDVILKNRLYVTVGEVKSGMVTKKKPRQHDRMQLVAGFVLAESFGKVKGGFLHYANASFFVVNTRRERKKLAKTLQRMQADEDGQRVKAKPNKSKCQSCIYRHQQCLISK